MFMLPGLCYKISIRSGDNKVVHQIGVTADETYMTIKYREALDCMEEMIHALTFTFNLHIYICLCNDILRLIVHERFIQLKGNLLQSCKRLLPTLTDISFVTKNIYIKNVFAHGK